MFCCPSNQRRAVNLLKQHSFQFNKGSLHITQEVTVVTVHLTLNCNLFSVEIVNVCMTEKERERGETSDRDLGHGDFTFYQEREREKGREKEGERV